MDLNKLENLSYLQQINNDEDLLIKEIDLTKGYVLTKLKAAGLLPEINVLMTHLNEYSIQFVMHNYSLDVAQKEKTLQFLNDSSEIRNKTIIKLSSEEIEKYLKEKKLLPKETVFSVEQINKFLKEIKHQANIEDNHLDKILEISFNKFTIDDYFKIDKQFFKDRPYLMDVPSYLSNKKYKQLFKDVYLSNDIYDIKEFSNYHFEESEKDFLFQLLQKSSEWSLKPYNEMSNIRGFSSLVQRDEYFEFFNSKSLRDYSDGDVEIKKDFIQAVWSKKELKHYDIFNDFLFKTCTVKQFATVMDKELMMKIINKSNASRVFGSIDIEREEVSIKYFHLITHFLDLFANETLLEDGKTISSQVGFYEIFNLIDELKESKYEYHNKNHPYFEEFNLKNALNIEKIFTDIIPKYLNNKDFYRLLSDSNYILNNKTIDSIQSMVDNNTNINLFYLLLSAHSKWINEKGYRSENISATLEVYLEQIHKKILTKKQDLSDDRFNNNLCASLMALENFPSNDLIEKLKNNYSNFTLKNQKSLIEDDNIFFAYEGKKLTEINEDLWALTSQLRPEFYNEVINKKILAPDNFMYYCLNNSNHQETKDFLIQYVRLHKEEIEKNENLLSHFLSNSNQKEIFPPSSNEEANYNELFKCIEQESLVNEERKSLENIKENLSQRFYSRKDLNLPEIDIETFDEKAPFDYKNATKIDIQTRYVDLYKKEEFLNKKQRQIKGKLSFEFMEEKIKKLIQEKNFTEIASLEKERMLSSHNELLVEFINKCNYKELMECFRDKKFLALFKSQINYDDLTGVKLDNFTDKENTQIANKLVKLFEGSTEKIFHFFAENNRSFIKDYVIENMPEKIFYSYSFLEENKETYKPTNFINDPYTNEEIYRAFKMLDDNQGFFCDTGVNSKVNTFFSSTFGSSNHRQDKEEKLNNQKKSLTRYLNFLDFVKQRDLKLYVLASHSDCFINNIGWGEKDENGKIQTRDEVTHNFFIKHFDFDLILKGMKQIVDEMKKRHGDNFNTNNASGAIISIIHNTYYGKYDEHHKSVYYSNMSHENTKKLFSFLFNEVPMICVERHKIGAALEPKKFFNENIQDIINVNDINSIENFLYPDRRVSTKYLRVDNDGEQQQRLLSFFTSIINHAIDTKNSATLEYLLHLVKQKEFSSKEISYSKRKKLEKKHENHSSDMFMEVIQENQDIKNLLKTLIFKNKLDNSLNEEKNEILVHKKKKL